MTHPNTGTFSFFYQQQTLSLGIFCKKKKKSVLFENVPLTWQRQSNCTRPLWQAENLGFLLRITRKVHCGNLIMLLQKLPCYNSLQFISLTIQQMRTKKEFGAIHLLDGENGSLQAELCGHGDNGVFYCSLKPFRRLFLKQWQPLQPQSHMALWATMDRQGNYTGFFIHTLTHILTGMSSSPAISCTLGGD